MGYNDANVNVLNYLFTVILLFVCALIPRLALSQEMPMDTLRTESARFETALPTEPDTRTQYDIADLARAIFYPNRNKRDVVPTVITIIPNIAANPTIGFQIGIKAVGGKKLGKDPATFMSVAATSATITTKGIINFYFTHNVFTEGNKWNIQGSLVAARSVVPDYGLGIGVGDYSSIENQVLTNPERTGYVFHSLFLSFREKIYKEVRKNLFAGAGVSFDIRRRVEDRFSPTPVTPYTIYNKRMGYSNNHYSSNGLLFNVQYTTRDNQNRAYRGMYADAGFRLNQTWMGSTKNALQFTADVRKYWSLSSRNPEHVIAWWNWGAYLIRGSLPYLELAGIGKDPASRSGRGYKIGYFKGTQFQYSEIEYRFPIMTNKFISGAAFFNIQSSNDLVGTRLFQQWQPGGGAGLRVLFNKSTRTNLCLDYAFGKFGSGGFFLGINETF